MATIGKKSEEWCPFPTHEGGFMGKVPLDTYDEDGQAKECCREGHTHQEIQAERRRQQNRNGASGNGHKPEVEGVTSFPSFSSLGAQEREWPSPMAEEAFHGLAGEIVEAILPNTEADPAALLMTFLAAFGNVVGLHPHSLADGAVHRLRLFAVLVGGTNEGKKGTSWARICPLFDRVDSAWLQDRVKSGVASGEGLIHAVRDPVKKTKTVDGQPVEEIIDEGVADKRLFVIEPEFSGLLKMSKRDGNIASESVRQAWEGDRLHRITKTNPLDARGAHVSILGHITQDELRRLLSDTETSNGFANRFLYLCCKRSKYLPEGGDDIDYGGLARKVGGAVDRARRLTLPIRRDAAARVIWAAIYPDLTADVPGLYGDVTARRAPQVLRLSATYAALDGSPAITAEHLLAAVAVWDRCAASSAYIFGDLIGDPQADTIRAALLRSPTGMTRLEISNLLSRNVDRDGIERALGLLEASGRARCEKVQSAGKKGRPPEVWKAVSCGGSGSDALLSKAKTALRKVMHLTKETRETNKFGDVEDGVIWKE